MLGPEREREKERFRKWMRPQLEGTVRKMESICMTNELFIDRPTILRVSARLVEAGMDKEAARRGLDLKIHGDAIELRKEVIRELVRELANIATH